jgi:hypothetical protein
MSETIGRLLAVGNVAEVFECGSRVLKLYSFGVVSTDEFKCFQNVLQANRHGVFVARSVGSVNAAYTDWAGLAARHAGAAGARAGGDGWDRLRTDACLGQAYSGCTIDSSRTFGGACGGDHAVQAAGAGCRLASYLKTPQSDLRQPLSDLPCRRNRAIGKRLTGVDQLIRKHR